MEDASKCPAIVAERIAFKRRLAFWPLIQRLRKMEKHTPLRTSNINFNFYSGTFKVCQIIWALLPQWQEIGWLATYKRIRNIVKKTWTIYFPDIPQNQTSSVWPYDTFNDFFLQNHLFKTLGGNLESCKAS